ncbi:MAG: pyrimidine/purine nucleoside phosphorylase [Verrucomicrobiota bacterium]|nr:pyrimidine/purine nucleoside phosphorylase [Verrucomicrobiota bacterium]
MTDLNFKNVTVHAKANIYFDGKVVSHSIILEDGSKKTLGIIYPGSYHFSTEQAERMEIITGNCKVLLDGSEDSNAYGDGQAFEVVANSGFTIEVTGTTCEYICSFIS